MSRNHPTDAENIYRICRIAANERAGNGRFSNHDKAAAALTEIGHPISGSSIKDYESGKTPVPPETVVAMAQAYDAPRLRYLHCAQRCPLGPHVMDGVPEDDDIYKTYFDLEGAFQQIDDIALELREIIADDALSDSEKPALNRIFQALETIIESTQELRIWTERACDNGADHRSEEADGRA